jgi:hypothetical protein
MPLQELAAWPSIVTSVTLQLAAKVSAEKTAAKIIP